MNIKTHGRLSTFAFIFLAVFALAAALMLMGATPAHATRDYGQLSSKYESTDDPGCVVSGVAYGAYQFTPANALAFATWLNNSTKSTVRDWSTKLTAAYASDGNKCGTKFNTAWKEIATASREKFYNYQYKYCKEKYYDVSVGLCQQDVPGFNMGNFSTAYRNVYFSTVIQHGTYGARDVFKKAVASLGGWSSNITEAKLIDAIYYERSRVISKCPIAASKTHDCEKCRISKTDATAKKYGIAGKYLAHFYSCSSAVQVGVYVRLRVNERLEAQDLLVRYTTGCKHTSVTGGQLTCSEITETTHVESVTAVVCNTCKAVVTEASVSTVKNEIVYSGEKALVKNAGTTAVAHGKSHYYAVKSKTLSLRTEPVDGEVLTKLAKKQIVKPTAVVVGPDGNYWAKVTVSGKEGYLRMKYLKPLGTASTHKFNSKGKCIYCGYAKSVLENKTAGTYYMRKASYTYVAASTSSAKVKGYPKGKKAKVVKAVKNSANDYWGLLKNGTYIKMTRLKK